MEDAHLWPYRTLFSRTVANLGPPDPDGWAVGDCPYCGDPGTFRVNLATGRWTCLPSGGQSWVVRQRASARRTLDLGWEPATDEQRACFAEAVVLPWWRARHRLKATDQ